ncbi:hypothetical protein SAMN02745225_01129, partial [Ferrithrix thermotolerans DSM 19514]
MASLVGKKQGKKTYYYLTESARVDEKPRIVSQRYLGSADEVTALVEGGSAGDPKHSRHLGFGDVATTCSVIEKLGIADIVDEVVGARRSDAGASVGTYISLAVLNRVVAPTSKLGFAQWAERTVVDRLCTVKAKALDHRRFWDAMDQLTPKQMKEIEERVTGVIIESFGVDLLGLVLDMTNFATYIDSANTKAPIAQRGHAKQKRVDLRLIGLGLIVSTDGGIPLLCHAYPGNPSDVSQFPIMVKDLLVGFGKVAGNSHDLTMVYDAGQDSLSNQSLIHESPLHFVGSLPPTQHKDLLAIPRSDYISVDEERFLGITAYESRTTALGGEYRVILTHSETFFDKQR